MMGPREADTALFRHSHAAMAWRRWIRICAAERLVWDGTKRFRTAEKIHTKCCNEPTYQKPVAFVPVPDR